MNPWDLLEKASNRAHFQAESVGICLGHMMNAIVDLESGETKVTAVKTLRRGIALIEERNAPARALAAAIADTHPKGGDVEQAPAESPQSGPKGNAQPLSPNSFEEQ